MRQFAKILFFITLSSLTFTTIAVENKTKSTGGLLYGSKDEPLWLEMGGTMTLEQRFFAGSFKSKGSQFLSGGHIRNLGMSLNGGIGKNLSYTMAINYDAKESKAKVDDAFITYSGFGKSGFGKNLSLSVGQVNPGFCVENTTSGKWTPFLERSMPTNAFGPCPGLGVSANKWDNNYSLIVSITQPKMSDELKLDQDNPLPPRNDRWHTTARVTYIPYQQGNKIIQLGVSGHHQDSHNAAVQFKTVPEAKGRNVTEVLDTEPLQSKHHQTIDLELSAQHGPLYAELEYQQAFVKLTNNNTRVKFQGYHIQAAYVLTGEARTFTPATGTFGQVKPTSCKGAWEIAARHSFINLNHKTVNGGYGRNSSIGLSYYVNNNVRVASEYIYSRQRKIENNQDVPRKLHIIGLRLQAVF